MGSSVQNFSLSDWKRQLEKIHATTILTSTGFGATHQADNAIWWHVGRRVRRFLCKRHKLRPRGASRFSQHEVYGPVGVVELTKYRRRKRNVHALSRR